MATENYLKLRQQVLDYSYIDMNLKLENSKQVYIAVFDIPTGSGIMGNETQTLALVFGLNTHIYFSDGNIITDLERYDSVMKAAGSLLLSSGQVLDIMEHTSDTEYFNSKLVRAYLKTRDGIFFKELSGDTKQEKFLLFLLNNVLTEINKFV